VDLFEEKVIEGMHGDVFELYAEIIEMQQKPLLPTGTLAANPQGEIAEIDRIFVWVILLSCHFGYRPFGC
jgi:ornithine racemase